MPTITLILHNIRSTHNVGSIFRSAEGFGVRHIILSGYTPYPSIAGDTRLPHIAAKLTAQIHKTALGAETIVPFEYINDIDVKIHSLKQNGALLYALEQHAGSVPLKSFTPASEFVLILGEEVDGISKQIIDQCDEILEIPMHGQKESFNVSVAAGIALYALAA